ncbi:MAG: lytic transglycosylase domain-containing protein, partial [Deltaproteobacteria bacterium]|nr:lytic transglycosylase domain-containing protein [Deltaproteobacteria bacterium]
MSVSSRGFAAGGLVALALLAPEAQAERKAVQPLRKPSAAPEPEKAPELRVLLDRDFEIVRSVTQGSPVARRARARRRHRLAKRRNSRALLASIKAFRASQKGPFDRMILSESEKWGLDPFLFKGLLVNESRLDPKLTGKRIYEKVRGRKRAVGGGARGIAQFTFSGVSAVNEARQRRYYRGERVEAFRRKDVWDAELSIAASAELLASFIDRFGRDGGVTAYNTGPYGGRLVAKHGFYRARASGKLSRVGRTRLQGHRFLLNVLRKSNALRRDAGLPPLPRPG